MDWGMTGRSDKTADGIGKALPNSAVLGQGASAALRQRVCAPSPSRLSGGPTAVRQAHLLKPMQGRIDGSLSQLECTGAAAMNLLDHRIAVRRAGRERGQHDHVEMPFEHFTFHGRRVPLATLGVNTVNCKLFVYNPRYTGARRSCTAR